MCLVEASQGSWAKKLRRYLRRYKELFNQAKKGIAKNEHLSAKTYHIMEITAIFESVAD